MKKLFLGVVVSGALGVNGFAFANAVEDKCVAAVKKLGGAYENTDPVEGCACFSKKISETPSLVDVYLKMDTDSDEAWAAAPDELKKAASACFPGT